MKSALLFLLAVLTVSCSNDDPETSPPPTSPDGFFLKFKYDGIQYLNGEYYPTWNPLNPIQSDHYFMTINTSASTSVAEGTKLCQITFSKYGDIVSAYIYDYAEGYSGTRRNYKLVAGENFHFELEAIDETAQTVKGNFSGRLYHNPLDLNSASVEIEGSFYNEYYYTDEDEGFYGLSAKIDGADWHSIDGMTPNAPLTEAPYHYNDAVAPGILTYEFISDDRYRIIMGHGNSVGVDNFTGSSDGAFVRLGRYNPDLGVYEDFETISGQLVISEYTGLSQYVSRYRGVFNFTAINPDNPSQTIQITDGVFYYEGPYH